MLTKPDIDDARGIRFFIGRRRMKIPKEIVTRHKIRDAKICRLWLYDNLTQEDIGQIFDLTQQAICSILYKNRKLLTLDRNYEKQKRIHTLKRSIKNAKESQKDKADLIEQLRREIEGNEKLHIDQSKHTHITYVREKLIKSSDPLSSSRLPVSDREQLEAL